MSIWYYEDGSIGIIQYIRDNVLHCDTGPAVMSWDPDGSFLGEEWRVHGVLHNEHGPAIIYRKKRQWYLRGKKYTREEFITRTNEPYRDVIYSLPLPIAWEIWDEFAAHY